MNKNTRNTTLNKIQEYEVNYLIHGIDYIHETRQKTVSGLLHQKGYFDISVSGIEVPVRTNIYSASLKKQAFLFRF